MNDYREALEQRIREEVRKTLMDEKLENDITVSQVQVRSIRPADSVVESANNLVKAKNEEKQKAVEVNIASLEADRMAALARNAGQSIAYMQAQAQLKIADGIAAGKVNTIVVPVDFKGMVNVSSK